MKKILAVILIASIFSAGCASTPANPVPVAQVGDDTKTCDAITNEMQQMISAQQMAASDKNTQVGSNVALGVTGIFLLGIPWFFMDLGGAASAEQKAAKARYDRLQQMQVDRKCTVPPTPITVEQKVEGAAPILVTAQPAKPQQTGIVNPAARLEELNTMLKKGLITQSEFNSKRAEILKNM
jgi:hypothetical protein